MDHTLAVPPRIAAETWETVTKSPNWGLDTHLEPKSIGQTPETASTAKKRAKVPNWGLDQGFEPEKGVQALVWDRKASEARNYMGNTHPGSVNAVL